MDVLKSMNGMVRVELTSADLTAAFGAISERGIPVYNTIQTGELSTELTISRSDYRRLSELCKKRGDNLRMKRRTGAYWTGKQLFRRPVLLFGLVLFLTAALYLPTRVFFVQVEGNSTIPARLILAAAEECGIGFGASRREVRSERMKNALLEAVPQLQWAGVNTYGCVAVISVRERAELELAESESNFGSIVAIRDGVITDCTATRGNLLCAVGQAVSEGQVLISGYTDCGICIRAEQAEGEVYARTRRILSAVIPLSGESRGSKGEEKKKISILIGKKRINLWKDSGIWDTTCDRMYTEYYVTLPGGFQLPVALIVECYILWDTSETTLSQEAAEHILTDFGSSYLKQQMVAGQIRTADLSFQTEEDVIRLTGEYVCIEMIGKMQREQIGEYNGEDS